jgi:hypothetical protein
MIRLSHSRLVDECSHAHRQHDHRTVNAGLVEVVLYECASGNLFFFAQVRDHVDECV